MCKFGKHILNKTYIMDKEELVQENPNRVGCTITNHSNETKMVLVERPKHLPPGGTLVVDPDYIGAVHVSNKKGIVITEIMKF